MKHLFTTTLRLNLHDEADRRAWERLRHMDKRQYKSYSNAIVTALNDYFDRQERLENDPYLETREKEDAFLQRITEVVAQGLRTSVPITAAGSFAQLLASRQPASSADPQEEQADTEAALDFVDGF